MGAGDSMVAGLLEHMKKQRIFYLLFVSVLHQEVLQPFHPISGTLDKIEELLPQIEINQ